MHLLLPHPVGVHQSLSRPVRSEVLERAGGIVDLSLSSLPPPTGRDEGKERRVMLPLGVTVHAGTRGGF